MRISHLLIAFTLCLPAVAADSKEALIARGKYLVEEVAKCQMCHTPRLENGEYDKEKWLKGMVLDFAPMKEVKGWHKTSPDLTPSARIWSRWGEATILKYLQTGLAQNGKPADPPMPAYKFSAPDAEAVLAYLKSLK